MTLTLRSRLLFLAGLLAFQLAWIVALPAFTAMDEFDHAYRAGSVAAGHWQAGEQPATIGRGVLLLVPEDLPRSARDVCLALRYTGWDNCIARTEPNAAGEVTIASAAGNYNPTYYWWAGGLAAPFEGDAALFVMRTATVLLSNLLLFGALSLNRHSLSGWALAGFAVVLTPTITYATAVAAPNGVGFAGAILLWTALLRLPTFTGTSVRGPILGVVAGAAVVMCTHATGPLWVLAIAVCGAPLWWPRFTLLLRHHPRVTAATFVLLSVFLVACILWIATSGTNDPRQEDEDLGPVPIALLLKLPLFLALQSVATLQFRNQAAPTLVYVLGLLAMLAFLGLTWRRSTRRARAAMGLTALAALIAPLAATLIAYPLVGNAWQARYGFPLYVGLFLVSLEASRGMKPRRAVGFGVLVLAGALQALTLWSVLNAEFGGASLATADVLRYVLITLLSLVGIGMWLRAFSAGTCHVVVLPAVGVETGDATVRA
ncbi:DUF2142 domain-containing protein [Nocardioides sp.]|uniref:DUF2142 domain-containing protein n=1 Tax=Nocardioides sp. TaxID=35761 RepID=UPI00286B74BD|nr:DUF2142 domain-containing protein [Nocardioides sp.]